MYANYRNNLKETQTMRNPLPLSIIGMALIKILFNLALIFFVLKIPYFENVYHVIITLLVFYIATECSN